MDDIKGEILAFLDVCSGHEDLDEQERLLLVMLENFSDCTDDNDYQIRTNMNGYSTISNRSIRNFLGDLNSETIHRFVMALADIMAHRHDIILPATQDADANEEAMMTSAISLTRHSFLAAKVYAKLLGLSGSWGAGIVSVGALSSLSALIRRWCIECSSISEIQGGIHDSSSNQGKRRTSDSKAIRNKKKRLESDEEIESVDYEIGFEDVIESSSGLISDFMYLYCQGLDLTHDLSQIPVQAEFLYWSDDALEIMFDAVMCALMTTAALKSKDIASQCDRISDHLTQALSICAKNFVSMKVANEQTEIPTSCKSHVIMIFLLRGIFSLLSLKIGVPQGQKGKELAHAVGANLLECVIKELTHEFKMESLAIQRAIPIQTPTNSARNLIRLSPLNKNTPRTGRNEERRRVIVEGLTPATLKINKTPTSRKRGSTASHESENTNISTVLGFLQKLITMKDLDRSDSRKLAISVVMKCSPLLPAVARSRFLCFSTLLCISKISVHRLTGCELIGKVLSQCWFWTEHANENLGDPSWNNSQSKSSPLIVNRTIPHALFSSLIRRLLDKTPAVRVRATTSIIEIFVAVKSNGSDLTNPNKSSLQESIEPFLSQIMNILQQRSVYDDRATVRKTSVTCLSEISTFCQRVGIEDQDILQQMQRNIEIFGRLCGDSSVSTRKSAADALSEMLILQYSSSETVPITETKFLPLEYAWSKFVLPLVLDSEPSCCHISVELFYLVVVDRIVQRDNAAWRVLACVSDCTEMQGSSKGEFEALKTAVRKMTENYDKGICVKLFDRTRERVLSLYDGKEGSTEAEMNAVWCLLRALTDQAKELPVFTRWIKGSSVGQDFLTRPLRRMLKTCTSDELKNESTDYSTLRLSLNVVTNLAMHLEVHDAESIATTIKVALRKLCLGAEVIGAAVSAMVACLRRHVVKADLRLLCVDWVNELYDACERELSVVVCSIGKGINFASGLHESLVRALYLVGELAMVGFRTDEGGSLKEKDVSDPIIGLALKPSEQLLNFIKVFLPNTFPEATIPTPEPARAHAFVTMGKLCLREEKFAKECLNMFARELHQNLAEPSIAVQSNALLVLGDLCFKYTNLVERHIPVMAACLQAGVHGDSEQLLLSDSRSKGTALIRKHAILMLSSLLLQDFIKWRGLMFQRFLVATSDVDDSVASLAEMTLCGPLLSRYPKLFLNNFVESILVLNKCTGHPIYLAAACAGDNGAGNVVSFDGIDMSGTAGQARRRQMYRIMLSKMSDEEKIGVAARLAKDILGAATLSEGDLGRVCRIHSGKTSNSEEEAAFAVLSDAFFVLASPEIRVGRQTQTEDYEAEDPIDNSGGKSAKLAVAKGRLMSNISRKQLVEIILPILCNLKVILQSSCSPLLKDLSIYLREIFRAYKAEVKDFLANDPTLLQEVEFDLKQFTKARQSFGQSHRIEVSSGNQN
jgi:condensin-2 complex subunit D3